MNYHKTIHVVVIAALATASFLLCPAAHGQGGKAGLAQVVWPWWFADDGGNDCLKELESVFAKSYPSHKDSLALRPHDHATVGRFADKDDPFGVLIALSPDQHGQRCLVRRFSSGTPQPEKFFFGQRRLIVVASKDLRLEQASQHWIQGLLRKDHAAKLSETKIEEKQRLPARLICGDENSWGHRFLRRNLMAYERTNGEVIEHTYYEFRDDLQKVSGPKEVLAAVRKQPKSIGFVEYRPDLDFTGVDVLAAQKDGEDLRVKPRLDEAVQEDYPFSDTFYLYLHPSAEATAAEFCQFVIGPQGAAILEKYGFQTSGTQGQLQASARLTQLQTGKGVRMSVVGSTDGKTVIPALVTEYAKAKAVVQVNYVASDSDVSAVGTFVNGNTGGTGNSGVRELLLLGDKPSPRAMEVHGKKWNSLGVDEDGKSDGTGPVEYVVAGRAVAVVVNSTNKVESLTLGQIQAIFRGEVDDWAVIGGTELAAGRPVAGDAAGGKARIPIRSFGLRAGGADARSSVVAGVFHSEVVAAGKIKRMVVKKDTAEVVAAVSMDSQAIGFVDLTAIPGMGAGVLAGDVVVGALADDLAAGGQSVRVLAIQMGTGERAKFILPTADNIKNAMYPLSQRLYLYVHPQASETAKDFAKFMATCGASEASPYTDTVKAMMEAYRKHGLIPLAEEAMVRAAKDAMAEAEAKDAKTKAAGK